MAADISVVESPILAELRSDLEQLKSLNILVTDEDQTALNLCKTLESAFRHGLIRESREKSDFFDVILALFDQQNSVGRKFLPFNINFGILYSAVVKGRHRFFFK